MVYSIQPFSSAPYWCLHSTPSMQYVPMLQNKSPPFSNTATHPLKIVMITTYAPQKCGIASYSQEWRSNMLQYFSHQIAAIDVIAVSPNPSLYSFNTSIVKFVMQKENYNDYYAAAQVILKQRYDIVLIEHEYGIFGGVQGSFILALIQQIKKFDTSLPIFTTLHTVLPKDKMDSKMISATKYLIEWSDKVVTLSESGCPFLQSFFTNQQLGKCILLHFGVEPIHVKQKVSKSKTKKVMTFGLLSQSKGIEYMLEAMKKLVPKYPQLQYVIIGQTHPEIGPQYLQFLQSLVKEYKLQKNVEFRSKYYPKEQLVKHLANAFAYVNAYPSKDQISSGSLTQALALGLPIISTDYHYAVDLLQPNQTGLLVPVKQSDALANALELLLKNNKFVKELKCRTIQKRNSLVWPVILKDYLIQFLITKRQLHKVSSTQPIKTWNSPPQQVVELFHSNLPVSNQKQLQVGVPIAPKNVRIAGTTDTSITVHWDNYNLREAGNSTITSYTIELTHIDTRLGTVIDTIHVTLDSIIVVKPSSAEQSQSPAGEVLGYIILNLIPNISYSVRMLATNAFGSSPYSSALQVSTIDITTLTRNIILAVVIPVASIFLCCILIVILLILILCVLGCVRKHRKDDMVQRAKAASGKPVPVLGATEIASHSNPGYKILDSPMTATNTSIFDSQGLYSTNYTIDYKLLDFTDSQILGSGGQGMVVTAKYFDSPVAVKFFAKNMMEADENEKQGFYTEAKFLAQHSSFLNIIRFIGIANDTEKGRTALVTELCPGGSLSSVIEKVDLSFDDKVRILFGISSGMRYLHSQNIIHRDLKAENVLLDSQFVPKICDFGFSKQLANVNEVSNMTVNVGTAAYIAPEAISLDWDAGSPPEIPYTISTNSNTKSSTSNSLGNTSLGNTTTDVGNSRTGETTSSEKKSYDRKMDVYSFGIIMYVVYTGNKNPYGKNISAFQIMNQLARNPHFRPTIPENIPPEHVWYIELMKHCWRTDPTRRPDFEYISATLQEHVKFSPRSSTINLNSVGSNSSRGVVYPNISNRSANVSIQQTNHSNTRLLTDPSNMVGDT